MATMNGTIRLEHSEYLGDGVTAGFDEYYLYLKRTAHDGTELWVALEPDVWRAFLEYAQRQLRIQAAKAEAAANA